jgi:single stranded DNA-binding protein
MDGVNKVIIFGVAGGVPSYRKINDNLHIANFTLKTVDKIKGSNGVEVERTESHYITVFGGKAIRASTDIQAGTHVYIEGKAITRKHIDQHKGETLRKEVQANEMRIFEAPAVAAGGVIDEQNEPNGNIGYRDFY